MNPTLDRIKRALASARLPEVHGSPLPGAAATPRVDPASLVDSFTRELTLVRGKVYRSESPAHAVELTLRLLKEIRPNELLIWDEAQLPLSGLGAAVLGAGYSILEPTLPTEAGARHAKLTELGRAGVGITGALAGLADTGTLVLTSGPGRPRLASLLPPVHIALLPIVSLLPSLPALFARDPTLTEQGSNLILITGPSRTADIEMTVVFGVHGPKDVHVILV